MATDNDFAVVLSEEQKDRIRAAALGQIFRLGTRAAQPGDVEAFERAKRAFLATYTDEELATARSVNRIPPHASPVPRHPKDT